LFAKELKLYRRLLGLTQAELGRAVGVSASAVGMYEQGRRLPGRRVYSRLRRLFLRQGLELRPLPDAPEGPSRSDMAELLSLLRR